MDSESGSSIDSDESESIDLLKDDQFFEDEQRTILGKLTRSLMFRPMWKDRVTALGIMSGYILAYSTFARFCHFFDIYGLMFFVPFVVCMLIIGLPLVYLELALGQFTSLNSIVIFSRMVPPSKGLGVSMTLLSILVTITDHLALYSFVAVFGNSLQVNMNEMPWHECFHDYNSEDCKTTALCPKTFKGDFFEFDNNFLYERESGTYHVEDYAGQCIRSGMKILYPKLEDLHKNAKYSALKRTGSTYDYLSNNIGMVSTAHLIFQYPSPEQFVALCGGLALLVLVSMRGRSFVIKSCFLTVLFSYVLMIGFILAIATTPSRQHHTWLDPTVSFLDLRMWGSSLLLTLNVLRIGQSGLFSLGAQNRFNYNVLIDAVIVVLYVLLGTFLFAFAHLLMVSAGGLQAVNFVIEKFNEFFDELRKENMYYQLFDFWTTMTNLAVYGSYETYAQFALSTLCTMLAINSTFVWLELFVSSCVTTSNSLSERVSQVTIHRTAIICFALPFFIVKSRNGFHALVAVENTVIPVASGVLVTLELLVIGGVYGFKRVWSNISSMSNEAEEEDNIARRICGLFFTLTWTATPVFVLLALIFAYPYPHPDARKAVAFIFIIIFAPIPIYASLKIAFVIRRNIPLRSLYNPDQNLWGPRNEENRVRAAAWEKKINVRQRW